MSSTTAGNPEYQPVQPGFYAHYKGDVYEVIGVAPDMTAAPEPGEGLISYVIYRPLESSSLFVRTRANFTEFCDYGEGKVPRFRKMTREEIQNAQAATTVTPAQLLAQAHDIAYGERRDDAWRRRLIGLKRTNPVLHALIMQALEKPDIPPYL